MKSSRSAEGGGEPVIKPDWVVTLSFVMRSLLPGGSLDQRPPEQIEFVFGVERQVPTLEKALEGASPGHRFSLRIPASELYGARDPSLIKEIPKEGLIKQRLRPGNYYRQMKKGGLVSFKVLEVRPHTVLVDFNPPLSGIDVSMDVEVLDLRKASPEELRAARESEIKRRIGCS